MNLPVDAPAHTPAAVPEDPHAAYPKDSIEQVVHLVPLVLPIVGAVLMFLLAFIAIYMA